MKPDALAFEIHHPNHAVLHNQWHRDFGANIGVRGDVTRVGERVFDADGFAGLGRRAGDSAAKRDVVEVHALIVALAEAAAQDTLGGIQQQNALKASNSISA